jgi:redox-sensing transcriptional repressor
MILINHTLHISFRPFKNCFFYNFGKRSRGLQKIFSVFFFKKIKNASLIRGDGRRLPVAGFHENKKNMHQKNIHFLIDKCILLLPHCVLSIYMKDAIMESPIKSIPYPVIQRLAKYLLHVKGLRRRDVAYTFSHEIAECFGITSQTVRGDLSYLHFSGKPKKGYNTAELEKALLTVLGMKNEKRAVIIGAGNIGRGMILHKEFLKFGFNICAIFDSSERLIGERVGCFKIKSMDLLPQVIKEKDIKIGIIAVPPDYTQKVADQLIAAGIRGILNFAESHLSVPERVAVTNIHIVSSLLELSALMKRKGKNR